ACRAHALGIADALPRRAPKTARPVRHGIAWVAIDAEERVLTERRADDGLLGGMLAVPGTGWTGESPSSRQAGEDVARPAPPLPGDWRPVGEVRHTFTHFHLRLDVRLLRLTRKGGAGFLPLDEAIAAMPTVFAKAVRLARGALQARP